MYAYTDCPYIVIPVYMPCIRGPDKLKPVNRHSNTQYSHLETIKATRKVLKLPEVLKSTTVQNFRAPRQRTTDITSLKYMDVQSLLCYLGPINNIYIQFNNYSLCAVEIFVDLDIRGAGYSKIGAACVNNHTERLRWTPWKVHYIYNQ